LNIRWSTPELAHALQDSEASLLLVHESLRALAPADAPALVPLDALEDEGAALEPMPDTRTGGDALAAILYTGGTTGRSKGGAGRQGAPARHLHRRAPEALRRADGERAGP